MQTPVSDISYCVSSDQSVLAFFEVLNAITVLNVIKS